MNRWERMESGELQDIRPPLANTPGLSEFVAAFGSIAVTKELWEQKIKGPKMPPRTDYSAVVSLGVHFHQILFSFHDRIGQNESMLFRVQRWVPGKKLEDGQVISWDVEQWVCRATTSTEGWEGNEVDCLTFGLETQ